MLAYEPSSVHQVAIHRMVVKASHEVENPAPKRINLSTAVDAVVAEGAVARGFAAVGVVEPSLGYPM